MLNDRISADARVETKAPGAVTNSDSSARFHRLRTGKTDRDGPTADEFEAGGEFVIFDACGDRSRAKDHKDHDVVRANALWYPLAASLH